MRTWWVVVLLTCVLLPARPAAAQPGAGSAAAAGAAPPPRSAADEELERRFRADLAAASPAAAEAFAQATAARDAGRLEEALAGFRRASELAPRVDHPRRRACSMLHLLRRPEEALPECEAALELDPGSPYDMIALAEVLLQRNEPGDGDRTLALAVAASEKLPGDPDPLEIRCSVLYRLERYEELKRCTVVLLKADPEGMGANYFGTLLAMSQGDPVLAQRRLEMARVAGLSDGEYRRTLAAIKDWGHGEAARGEAAGGEVDRRAGRAVGQGAEKTGPVTAFLWGLLEVLVVWLGVMVVLLAAGYALSRLTLRAVSRVTAADAGTGLGTAGEQRLRRLYKAVLLLCGVYFYLSMPILLAAIVVAGGGTIYLFFAMGFIPIKLLLIVAAVVLFTVGAVLRSLFVRSVPGSLGQPVDLERHPRLEALLRDVAGAVGTRRVDAVYLTPGTEMAVTERAGLWASLRGTRSERSLIMGVGLFDGMTQLQLRSVLAHEHGHFRNADTAGGGLALAVRASLFGMVVRLARSGVAGAYNPVWWFLRAYHRVYLGISQGASRLQEVLADRWAIQAYGTAGFVDGYRHVVARSVQFHRQLDATLEEVVDGRRALPNLYQYRPEPGRVPEAELAAAVEAELARAPSAYDSHPAPRQRLEWATALAVAREVAPEDDAPIWELFDGREEIERAMTAEVRERIRENHGIAIPEIQADGDEDDADEDDADEDDADEDDADEDHADEASEAKPADAKQAAG